VDPGVAKCLGLGVPTFLWAWAGVPLLVSLDWGTKCLVGLGGASTWWAWRAPTSLGWQWLWTWALDWGQGVVHEVYFSGAW